MSLSGVFDNTSANDLLKSLTNILTEYDQSKDDINRPKMVRTDKTYSEYYTLIPLQRFFRSNKMPRRQAGAMNDYTMSFPDAGEATYLVTPHIVSVIYS